MYTIKSAGLLAFLLGSVQLCSAVPAVVDLNGVEATNPGITWAPIVTTTAKACTSVVAGVTKKPSCYTHTQTISRKPCPTAAGLMCPAYIKITTKDVPCANSCCPTTKTKTVTQTGCATGCVVPTQTVIRTTGCKTSATPTKTPVLTLIG